MADFYNTSGTLASNALEDILTSQRVEARQKMLDQLNEANVRSQIADRDENTRTNAFNRDSMRSDRAAQAEERKAAAWQLRVKPLHMGQDVSQMDPNLLNEGMGLGYFSHTPPAGQTPSVTTSETPGSNLDLNDLVANAPQPEAQPTPPSNKYYYSGSPQEIKDDQEKSMLGNIISQYGSDNPSLMEWALLRQAMQKGENPPSNILTPQKSGSAYIFDDATGNIKPAVDPTTHKPITNQTGSDQFLHIPRPPVPSDTFIGMSPDGKSAVFTDKQGNMVSKPLPDGGLAPKPSATGHKPEQLYDPKFMTALQSALGKTNPSPQAILEAVTGIIGSTPPAVREDLRTIMNTPGAKRMSWEDLTTKGIPGIGPLVNTPDDPQHLEKVRTVLDLIKNIAPQ